MLVYDNNVIYARFHCILDDSPRVAHPYLGARTVYTATRLARRCVAVITGLKSSDVSIGVTAYPRSRSMSRQFFLCAFHGRGEEHEFCLYQKTKGHAFLDGRKRTPRGSADLPIHAGADRHGTPPPRMDLAATNDHRPCAVSSRRRSIGGRARRSRYPRRHFHRSCASGYGYSRRRRVVRRRTLRVLPPFSMHGRSLRPARLGFPGGGRCFGMARRVIVSDGQSIGRGGGIQRQACPLQPKPRRSSVTALEDVRRAGRDARRRLRLRQDGHGLHLCCGSRAARTRSCPYHDPRGAVGRARTVFPAGPSRCAYRGRYERLA